MTKLSAAAAKVWLSLWHVWNSPVSSCLTNLRPVARADCRNSYPFKLWQKDALPVTRWTWRLPTRTAYVTSPMMCLATKGAIWMNHGLLNFMVLLIQSCVYAVRDEWEWLQSAAKCLRIHLDNAADYHKVFSYFSNRFGCDTAIDASDKQILLVNGMN